MDLEYVVFVLSNSTTVKIFTNRTKYNNFVNIQIIEDNEITTINMVDIEFIQILKRITDLEIFQDKIYVSHKKAA